MRVRVRAARRGLLPRPPEGHSPPHLVSVRVRVRVRVRLRVRERVRVRVRVTVAHRVQPPVFALVRRRDDARDVLLRRSRAAALHRRGQPRLARGRGRGRATVGLGFGLGLGLGIGIGIPLGLGSGLELGSGLGLGLGLGLGTGTGLACGHASSCSSRPEVLASSWPDWRRTGP